MPIELEFVSELERMRRKSRQPKAAAGMQSSAFETAS